MSITIYICITLVAGVVVTYLMMRLHYEKKLGKQLLNNERLAAELRASQEALTQNHEALTETEKQIGRIELENSLLSTQVARIEAEKNATEQRLAEQSELYKVTVEKYNSLLANITTAREEYARLQAEHSATQEKLDNQKVEMEKLHAQMLSQFKNMATEIMEEKSRSFREMSGENLKGILEPFKARIDDFKKQVTECYDAENKDRSTLQEQIRQLLVQNEKMRSEADKLTSALRGSTKVQGNWGEMILQNILQQSGLREGEDYELQRSVDERGDNKRPDAILHFPNHSDLIVDSKVSFTAYDSYMNAESDEERRKYARQHLDSIYNHVRQLAARDYPSRHKQSAEFVIMFIPIESMFMLALDEARAQNKNLWNDAYQGRVIIMTPTNLVVAVRLLQDMWRQSRLEANIRAIKERAEKLYTQFVSFATDIEAVRRSISNAATACDSAYRRLTNGNDNLIIQIDKMRRLGLEPKLPSKQGVKSTWSHMLNEAGVADDTSQARAIDESDEKSINE